MALKELVPFPEITQQAKGMARDSSYPVQAFRLTVNGANIANLIALRLIRLALPTTAASSPTPTCSSAWATSTTR